MTPGRGTKVGRDLSSSLKEHRSLLFRVTPLSRSVVPVFHGFLKILLLNQGRKETGFHGPFEPYFLGLKVLQT